MRLKKNNVAPYFSAGTIDKGRFDLSTPRSKPTMLAFFRYASCPFCNLRVHELIKNYENLHKNLDIILIFQSPKDKIIKYVIKDSMPYAIIADPDERLYDLYSVEISWLGFAKAMGLRLPQIFKALFKHNFRPGTMEGNIHRIPADIIIDSDNKIIKAHYGKDIGDHLELSEIYKILENYETR